MKMKNWKKFLIGSVIAAIGSVITMWPDKKEAITESDSEEIETEIVDVPAEEIKEVSEEVTEG